MILENDLNNAIAATPCGSFPNKACHHDWMPITGEDGQLLWVCRLCAGETSTLEQPHPALRVCPFCQDAHAAGKCPRAAGGGPWEELTRLRAANQALRLQLASADEHVGALTKALDDVLATESGAGPNAYEAARIYARAVCVLARAWLRRGA